MKITKAALILSRHMQDYSTKWNPFFEFQVAIDSEYASQMQMLDEFVLSDDEEYPDNWILNPKWESSLEKKPKVYNFMKVMGGKQFQITKRWFSNEILFIEAQEVL